MFSSHECDYDGLDTDGAIPVVLWLQRCLTMHTELTDLAQPQAVGEVQRGQGKNCRVEESGAKVLCTVDAELSL